MIKTNKVKVIVKTVNFVEEDRKAIVSKFSNFESDKKPFGTGPYYDSAPVLIIALTFAGASITGGFLAAVGADIWKLVKQSLSNAVKIKPKQPKKGPVKISGRQGRVECYLYFKNKSISLFLEYKDENLTQAIELLPEAIDQAYKKRPNFLGLEWDGKGLIRF